jgi:hypothetical protein
MAQVAMSIRIVVHTQANQTPFNAAVRISQRKDDLLACIVMGLAFLSQGSKAMDIVYFAATCVVIWLARRARERLLLMASHR